jgi:hypothetical protein
VEMGSGHGRYGRLFALGRTLRVAILALLVGGSEGDTRAEDEPAAARTPRESPTDPAPAPEARKPGPQDLIDQPIVAENPPSPTWVLDEKGDLYQVLEGNVRWDYSYRGERLILLCDRLVVVAPGALGAQRAADELAFYFHADGNVRLEIPRRDTRFEADAIYYERRRDGSQSCLLERPRLRTTLGAARSIASVISLGDVRGTSPFQATATGSSSLDRVAFTLSAEFLETEDFRRFSGEGVRATTCEYDVPQVGIGGEHADVEPVECDGCDDWVLELESPRFEIDGESAVPFPLRHWDTRWHEFFPIRDIHAGHSGKFGAFGGVDWNLNLILEQLPLARTGLIRGFLDRTRLAYETTYFSERGFGHGPKGLYGRDPREWLPWPIQQDEWAYYGESLWFSIRDKGEDRSSREVFGDPDRQWANVLHRQSVPYLGTIDVEYSEQSDANFLNEYFEAIAKREKEQESLFLLRRNFTDALSATALYKFRTNDFEATVERLPELRFFGFEQPIFATGLYSDFTAQFAHLRLSPAEGSPDPERSLSRFDLATEWSYPFHAFSPWVDLRPFAVARISWFEELLDPLEGSEDRLSLGAGMTASQQWSRVFDTSDTFLERWWNVTRLKHVVVPQATYFQLLSNDLPAARTLGIDAVDDVDREETVALSLRQSLVVGSRVPAAGAERDPILGAGRDRLRLSELEARSILDSEVSIVFFPRKGRDNAGDLTSLLVLDNSIHPGRYWTFRAWVAADVSDGFRFDRADLSTSVDVIPERLTVTVGERFTRISTPRPDTSSFLYSLADLRLAEKWRLQSYLAQDFSEGRNSEISFALVRVLPCQFGLVLEYSIDPGEDDNQTVSVNFGPLSLLSGLRRGILR